MTAMADDFRDLFRNWQPGEDAAETGGGSSSSGDDAVNATPSSLHGVRTSDRGAWPRSHAPDTPSSPGNLSLLGCLRQSFPALVELGAVILPGRSWCWWCTRREVGERSCVAGNFGL